MIIEVDTVTLIKKLAAYLLFLLCQVTSINSYAGPDFVLVPPVSDSNYCNNKSLNGIAGEKEFRAVGFAKQSLAIRVLVDLSDYEGRVFIPSSIDLTSGENAMTIPLDSRILKCWFQGGSAWRDIKHNNKQPVLVPELLLKDESIIRVDRERLRNQLLINYGSADARYVNTDKLVDYSTVDRNGRVPHTVNEFNVIDAANYVPVAGPRKYVVEFWVLLQMPRNIQFGTFSGKIEFSDGSGTLLEIPVALDAVPIQVKTSEFEYGLYYRALLNNGIPTIHSERRSPIQMHSDFTKMKQIGVNFATSYQGSESLLEVAKIIEMQRDAGLAVDSFYYLGAALHIPLLQQDYKAVTAKVEKILGLKNRYGIKNVYFYGVDEPEEKELIAQKRGWQLIHGLGGRVFFAGHKNRVSRYFGKADMLAIAYKPESALAARAHERGTKIFSYANPQGGVENPMLYRLGYGVSIWREGYDGALVYAYQDSFGSAWHDLDGKYRDHLMTYPTSTGSIDTIAWEGFREAIYDTRLIGTLEWMIQKASNKPYACIERGAISKARTLIDDIKRGRYDANLTLMRDGINAKILALFRAAGKCKDEHIFESSE